MIRLLSGDCRDVLATLPADSVHCVVTSPPYYGLRSYLDASHADKHREIGSEPTPEAYLQTMVAVFREVRRVLRPDGTCFVNMGDSYVSNGRYASDRSTYVGDLSKYSYGRNNETPVGMVAAQMHEGMERVAGDAPQPINTPKGYDPRPAARAMGLKPKDLLLMPARLALALQADGWWVRSDIIWSKPNPMPESCTDRPTSAHEHVFLLTRSARYFYDADAVREPHDAPSIGNRLDHYSKREQPRGDAPDAITRPTFANGAGGRVYHPAGRSCRNVWTIATAPYSEAHFATFPPALAERCIRAGTSERGCCAQCGKPWCRVVDKPKPPREVYTQRDAPTDGMIYSGTRVDGVMLGIGEKLQHWRDANPATTTGWRPSCTCDLLADLERPADPVPCTILDPFAGAGTSLLVADRLQRDAIGIELNVAYTQMAMDRVRADAPLLVDAPAAEPPEDARMADLFDMAAD